jgi:hypothetical protein
MSGGSSGVTAVGVQVTRWHERCGTAKLKLTAGAIGGAQCVTTAFKTSKLGQPKLATTGFQRFDLDMQKTEEIIIWNKIDGDAADIGFLSIPEIDARTLEARGAVFYNFEADRNFVPSESTNRVAQAHAIVGVVAEWTEEQPGGKPGERKAIIGGLFGVAKSITEFQEKGIDLVEVEINHTTGPSVPKSYGGVSGGALWKLHVELDASDKIVNIGKELRGVAFRQSGDPRLITCNDLPSISALKKAIADKWPEES